MCALRVRDEMLVHIVYIHVVTYMITIRLTFGVMILCFETFAVTCTCLSVFVAVKFGRMSKRQREMVQDEVKNHKKVRSTSSDSGSDTDMSIMEM